MPNDLSADFLLLEASLEVTNAHLDHYLKGYPEYDDDQPRGEDGRWSGDVGGGKALDYSSSEALRATVSANLRNAAVEVGELQGGWEVKAGDGGANLVDLFIPKAPDRPVTFNQVNSADDEGGRWWARAAANLVLNAAIARGSNKIRLEAAGAGGYVWPRIGFELDDESPMGDPVEYFVNNKEFARRVKEARSLMGWAEAREFGRLINSGGLGLPVKIAALDRELTPDEFSRVSGNNRYIRDVKLGRRTLGKALLIGVKGDYALPRAKFDVLRRYINRM